MQKSNKLLFETIWCDISLNIIKINGRNPLSSVIKLKLISVLLVINREEYNTVGGGQRKRDARRDCVGCIIVSDSKFQEERFINHRATDSSILGWMYCTVLYCTVLYCTVLYCTVLYCSVLHCTVLYYTALHRTVLLCTALHCTALYCTALYRTAMQITAVDLFLMR
jgi:hypothetical protein